MKSERVKEIFARVEPLGPDERRAILDGELADDPDTRAYVEHLLAASDDVDDSVFAPMVASPTLGVQRDDMPERIGPYRIESLLGRGGMACVYRAVQERPIRREVALKIVQPGVDTRAVLSRFDSERLALARLEHRNIATVLDAGADPYGPSWFSMTLVDGPPITEFCEQNTLAFRDRLRLFVQVCRGVQHAHTRGILHRDLKPSNILVSHEDCDPVPKIIDFGVAKALGADTSLGETKHTLDTQIVGTLEYMSPEQARLGNPDVDARSDVYALGVILYELLTGGVPIGGDEFTGVPLDAIQSLIQTKRPDKPSARSHIASPEDFDCVVLKSIEKDPDDRYESPKDLADDVERYLEGRPLAIRPPTRLYVLHQFARRNRALVTYASVLAVAVVLGLVGTSIGLLRALDREEQLRASIDREEQQEARLERLAEFQASRLGSTDLDTMAIVLRDSIADAATDSGRAGIEGTDFTEVARKGVAEHLLTQVVRDAETEFGDDPLLLAAVLQDTADSAADLGLFDAGLPIQDRALRLWREHAGPNDENTLLAQTNRATLLAGLGRSEEAEVIATDVAAAARNAFGEGHAATITADEIRGNMLRRRGAYDEAESAYRSVVERWTALQGANGGRTLRATVMLAAVLTRKGELVEAEAMSRRALELRRQVLAPDDPQVFLAHHQLGNVLFRLDRRDEAETELRFAIEGLNRTLGSRHPNSMTARGSLATVLFTRGNADEAIEVSRGLLRAKREVYGREHPAAIRELVQLASMLSTSGAHDEAAMLAEEAYDLQAANLGPTHPNTLTTANTIGMASAASKDHAKAERYYRLAYEGRSATLGNSHPDTLVSLRNLVGQLSMLGRHGEAGPLAEQLVTTAETALPAGHRHLAIFRMERGRSRTQLGRFADAEQDLLDAHSALAAALPSDHRFVVLAQGSLRELYEAWHAVEPDAGYDRSATNWRE